MGSNHSSQNYISLVCQFFFVQISIFMTFYLVPTHHFFVSSNPSVLKNSSQRLQSEHGHTKQNSMIEKIFLHAGLVLGYLRLG